jgi:hypothetical protein
VRSVQKFLEKILTLSKIIEKTVAGGLMANYHIEVLE